MKAKRNSQKSSAAKRERGSALNLIKPNAWKRNLMASVYGFVLDCPHGAQMLRVIEKYSRESRHIVETYFEAVENLTSCGEKRQKEILTIRNWSRKQKSSQRRWIGPRLAFLFAKAVESLDPKPFQDFAKILGAFTAESNSREAALPFHRKALVQEMYLRVKHRLDAKTALPVTQKEFLTMIGRTANTKGHDGGSYERRELKGLGIKFRPEKRGRPKKVTAKRIK